jgi:hypothetical protein
MKTAGFFVKGSDNGISYKVLPSRFLDSVHCQVIQTEHNISTYQELICSNRQAKMWSGIYSGWSIRQSQSRWLDHSSRLAFTKSQWLRWDYTNGPVTEKVFNNGPLVQQLELSPSNGPNRVGVSLFIYLNTVLSLEYPMTDEVQKPSNPKQDFLIYLYLLQKYSLTHISWNPCIIMTTLFV